MLRFISKNFIYCLPVAVHFKISTFKYEVLILQHVTFALILLTITKTAIHQLGWEIIEYPPYSLDLIPSDLYLFRSLSKNLRDKLPDHREAMETMEENIFSISSCILLLRRSQFWIQWKPMNLFITEIQKVDIATRTYVIFLSFVIYLLFTKVTSMGKVLQKQKMSWEIWKNNFYCKITEEIWGNWY